MSKPKNVDELNFTSRDSDGRIIWWDVTPPKTNNWGVHEALGRAYAFELLDLINNSEKSEELCEETFGFIAADIARKSHGVNDGLHMGFFWTISEYLITGRFDR